jgi:hypothetical protein
MAADRLLDGFDRVPVWFRDWSIGGLSAFDWWCRALLSIKSIVWCFWSMNSLILWLHQQPTTVIFTEKHISITDFRSNRKPEIEFRMTNDQKQWIAVKVIDRFETDRLCNLSKLHMAIGVWSVVFYAPPPQQNVVNRWQCFVFNYWSSERTEITCLKIVIGEYFLQIHVTDWKPVYMCCPRRSTASNSYHW